MKVEIEKEIESPQYKDEYSKSLSKLNSLLQSLEFINLSCSRSSEMKNKLFSLSVIDDIIQSIVAIKMLLEEGIRNTCRRELRYLVELAIKACWVSQKNSDSSIKEQIVFYEKELKNTNISLLNDIDYYLLKADSKKQFITEIKQLYGKTCAYVHPSPTQMIERKEMAELGHTIGFEGINELKELNIEIEKALSYVLILLLHSVPISCVGDFIVESNGDTIKSYFVRSKFFAQVDEYFDYKSERKDNIEAIKYIRAKNVEF